MPLMLHAFVHCAGLELLSLKLFRLTNQFERTTQRTLDHPRACGPIASVERGARFCEAPISS